ncbi:hypothetical protein Mal48_39550 [Thalassoglobus polymorphus]|uniref:Uncharacterized protein n=1 Tax=Thalassoglobus polymorphus TaxID=2527994 RepID=A0A517QST9_9PLAN|nr:hypothetical protein Mal48_39550 [Thalassoglobus polymorphus]
MIGPNFGFLYYWTIILIVGAVLLFLTFGLTKKNPRRYLILFAAVTVLVSAAVTAFASILAFISVMQAI